MISTLPSVSITKKMYGWSKWGGAAEGLVKEESSEWYCQICGQKQMKILPSYMFPFDVDQRDFCRVCSECKAVANRNHVVLYWDLIKIIKR